MQKQRKGNDYLDHFVQVTEMGDNVQINFIDIQWHGHEPLGVEKPLMTAFARGARQSIMAWCIKRRGCPLPSATQPPPQKIRARD